MATEDDDYAKLPDQCICGDAMGNAIISWAKVAIAYLIATELLVALIHANFASRVEMLAYQNEFKYYLRKSLSETDQEILLLTGAISGKRNQSPEEKGMMKKRSIIIQRIKLLFKKLVDEAFPRMTDEPPFMMSPPSITTPPTNPGNDSNGDDQSMTTTGLSLDAAFTEASSVTTNDQHFVKVSPTIADISVTNTTDVVAINDNAEQVARPRYHSKNPVDHDLFETPVELMATLSDVLDTIKDCGLVVFEPCAGNDAMVNFMEQRDIVVVARDKHTKSISHDFLVEPLPSNIGVIVTNPPFNIKYEIIKRCLEFGKPFILLLPLETMSTKTFHKIVGDTKFDLIVPIGRSKFLHAGKIRDVGATAWFLFSPTSTGSTTFKALGDINDIDIGSEDTEGGRHYDSDEEEERVRDQAVLDNPSTEFTAEGYVKDGFVLGDLLENGEEEEDKEDEDYVQEEENEEEED